MQESYFPLLKSGLWRHIVEEDNNTGFVWMIRSRGKCLVGIWFDEPRCVWDTCVCVSCEFSQVVIFRTERIIRDFVPVDKR